MSILEDGTVKFNCDMCFTNYIDCPYTGEKTSVPPEDSDLNMWTGPNFIKFFEKRARNTMDKLYGDCVEDISIDSYRMCWYVIFDTYNSHGLCCG
jgi:sarcosine oxidase/L-pipecolate oxidase